MRAELDFYKCKVGDDGPRVGPGWAWWKAAWWRKPPGAFFMPVLRSLLRAEKSWIAKAAGSRPG